jgi:hypothetical protein
MVELTREAHAASMITVRLVALLALIATGAASGIACGSVSNTDGEVGAIATTTCRTDTDCPSGQTCRSIRLGEAEQRACVPQTAIDDGGAWSGEEEDGASGSKDAGSNDGSLGTNDAGSGVDASTRDSGSDAGNGICTSALRVTVTSTGPFPSCVYNTSVVASSPAGLKHPCVGNGPASVKFGTQTFSGSVAAGVVTVTNVDSYSIDIPNTGTKCGYKNTQTISGTLSSGTLSYSYTEELAPNQPPICKVLSAACYQNGTVSVTSVPN